MPPLPANTPERASVRAALEALQHRLETHFRRLRNERDAMHAGAPIFALEHGLTEGELSVLQSTVSAAVWLRVSPRINWLPFIVHAAEIGYRYEGDEYWPTLEAQTPGWETGLGLGRAFVKARFTDFAQTFGGAEPRGRWASHFTIICWPITHAVLPTDLQRQLARLLYDYRSALTAELLETPSKLGLVLAGRSYNSSKRFQQFAENTELLGHVASALLAESPATAPLLPSTLLRIIADLSVEREARRWLQDAKASADRVRLRGMSGPGRATGPTTNRSPAPRPTTPVSISAHPGPSGWQLQLEVPDLAPLITRFPALRDELEQVRCTVAGTSGRPRPRGWLLYSGQKVRLERWPGRDTSVFQLERASATACTTIDQEARTPSNERWLFRLGPDGTGRLVRSGVVHTDATYLVMGEPKDLPPAEWVGEVLSDVSGTQAVLVEVPSIVDEEVVATLGELGCGLHTSVELAPVGLVPASWDGEGFCQFLAGDHPLLMLSSKHRITTCAISVDGHPSTPIRWPANQSRIFLQLPAMTVGWHDMRLSFLVAEGSQSVPDGRLEIQVREPETSRRSGTFREPLQIVLSPPGASIEDVWDGRATVEVNGPSGVPAKLELRLAEHDGSPLASQVCNVDLPVRPATWTHLRQAHLRGSKSLRSVYDEAMRLDIEVSDAELGFVRQTVERELEPLRWGFERSRGRTTLRLFESADTGESIALQHFSFERPGEAVPVTSENTDALHAENGGLFVARCGMTHAAAVLPRPVLHLEDLRSRPPRIATPAKTTDAILETLRNAKLWADARTPGDVWVEMSRQLVLDTYSSELACCLGGGRWGVLESRFRRGDTIALEELERCLAKPGDWRQFRVGIAALARSDLSEPPILEFARLLGPGGAMSRPGLVVSSTARRSDLPGNRFQRGGRWLAEFLLRLASSSWSVLPWGDASVGTALSEAIEHPLAFRAARLLAIQAQAQEEAWPWE